jgi:hypothetical protein
MNRASKNWGSIAGVALLLAGARSCRAQEVLPKTPTAPSVASQDSATTGGGMSRDNVARPALGALDTSKNYSESNQNCWQRFRFWLRDNFLGYAQEFDAPPLGAALFGFGQTQVANAEAAQLILNHFDFVHGTAKPTQRGREKLMKLPAILAKSFCPLIIEHTPEAPELDHARVMMVVTELGASGFAIPPERVLVGPPLSHDLSGVEALLIYTNLLGQIQSGAHAGGGGAGGGMGTSGLGAGSRGSPPSP